MLKTHLIEQWFVGTVLINTGLLIIYTFHFSHRAAKKLGST